MSAKKEGLFKAFKVSSVYTRAILPNKKVTQNKLNKDYLDNTTSEI